MDNDISVICKSIVTRDGRCSSCLADRDLVAHRMTDRALPITDPLAWETLCKPCRESIYNVKRATTKRIHRQRAAIERQIKLANNRLAAVQSDIYRLTVQLQEFNIQNRPREGENRK